MEQYLSLSSHCSYGRTISTETSSLIGVHSLWSRGCNKANTQNNWFTRTQILCWTWLNSDPPPSSCWKPTNGQGRFIIFSWVPVLALWITSWSKRSMILDRTSSTRGWNHGPARWGSATQVDTPCGVWAQLLQSPWISCARILMASACISLPLSYRFGLEYQLAGHESSWALIVLTKYYSEVWLGCG